MCDLRVFARNARPPFNDVLRLLLITNMCGSWILALDERLTCAARLRVRSRFYEPTE